MSERSDSHSVTAGLEGTSFSASDAPFPARGGILFREAGGEACESGTAAAGAWEGDGWWGLSSVHERLDVAADGDGSRRERVLPPWRGAVRDMCQSVRSVRLLSCAVHHYAPPLLPSGAYSPSSSRRSCSAVMIEEDSAKGARDASDAENSGKRAQALRERRKHAAAAAQADARVGSACSVGSAAAGAGTLVPSSASPPAANSHHYRLSPHVCSSGAPTEQTGGRGGGRGGEEERIREGGRGEQGGREGTALAGSSLEGKPDCLARRASHREGLSRRSSRSSVHQSSTVVQHPPDASVGVSAVHKPTSFYSLGLVSGSAVPVQEEATKSGRHSGDQGLDGADSSSACIPPVRHSGRGRSYSERASSPPSAVMVPALQQQRQTAEPTAQQLLQQENDNQPQKSGRCDTDSAHTKWPRQQSERQQGEPRQRGQSALPSKRVGGFVGERVEQGQAGVSAAVEQAGTVSFVVPSHLQKLPFTRVRSLTRECDSAARGKSATSGIGREVDTADKSVVAAVPRGEAGVVRACDNAPPIRVQSRAAFGGRSAAATTAAAAAVASGVAGRREGGESAAVGVISAVAEEQEPGSGSRSASQKGDETGAAADGGDGGGGGNESLLRGRSRFRAVRDGKAELTEKRRRLFSLHRRRTRLHEAEEDEEEKDDGAAAQADAEEGSPAKEGPRRTFEAGGGTAAEEGSGHLRTRLTFAPCPDDARREEEGGVEVGVSGSVSEGASGQGPADAEGITSHARGGAAAAERGGGRIRRRHLAVVTEEPAVAAKGEKEGGGRAEKTRQRNILVRSPRSLFITSVRSPREKPASPVLRRRRRENSSYNDEGRGTSSSTSQQEQEDVLPNADAEKKSARPSVEEEAPVAAVNAAFCGSATGAADPGRIETKRSAAAPGLLPRGSLVQQRVLRFASNEEAAVLRHKFEALAAAKEKEKTRRRAARRRRRAVRAAAAAAGNSDEGIRGKKGTALSLNAEGGAEGGEAGNNGEEAAPEGEKDGEDDSAFAADSVRRSLRGGGGSFHGSMIDKDSTSSLSEENVSDEDGGEEASHSNGREGEEGAMKETRIRRKTVFFEDVLREIERKATAAAEAYAREERSRSAERAAAQRSLLLRRSLSDASLPSVAGESDFALLTGGAARAAGWSSAEDGAYKNQMSCRQSPAAAAAPPLYSRRSTVGRVRERLIPRPAEVYEEAWKQKGAAAHGRFLQGLETTGWMRRLTEREISTYGGRSLPRSRTTWAVGVGHRRGHMQVRQGMRIKGKAKKQWRQQQQELRRPGRPTTAAAALQTSTTLRQQQQQEQADEQVGGRDGDAVATEGGTGADTKEEGGADEREQSGEETSFFSEEEEDAFAYAAMAKAREALAQQRKTKKYTTEKMGRSMAVPPPPRAVVKKMKKEAAGAAAKPRKKKEKRGHQIYPHPPKKTFSRYFVDFALSSTRNLAWWHWGAGQRWPLPVEPQPLRPEDMWESSTLDENSPEELEELFTSAAAPAAAGRPAAEGGRGALGGKTAAERGRGVAGFGEAPQEAAPAAEQHKSSRVSPVRTLLGSRAYRAFSGFFDKEVRRQKGEKLPPQTDARNNGSAETAKSEKEEGQEHLQQARETEMVEKETAAENGGVALSSATSSGDGGLSCLDAGEQTKEDFEDAEGGETRGKEEEQGSSAVPESKGRETSGGTALLAAAAAAAAVGVPVCATAADEAASLESSAAPAAGGGCTAADGSERRDEKSTVNLATQFAAKAGGGGTHPEVVAPPPAAAAGAAAQVEDGSADAVPKEYSGCSSYVAVWQKSSSPSRQMSALLKSSFSFALPFSSVGRGDKLTATRTVSPVSRPATPTARTTTTTAFSNTTGTTTCTTSRSSWRLRLLSSGREAHRLHQKQSHKQQQQQQEKREGSRYRHLQHGGCVPEVPSSCPVARALLDNLLLAQRNLVAAQTEATQLTHAKMKRLLARQRLLQRRRMLTAEAASVAQWMILREKDERQEMTEEDFDAPLSRPARQQLLLHAFVELLGTQIRLEGGEDGAGTQMDSAAAAFAAENQQALVNVWATAEDERLRSVRLRATTTEEPAEGASRLLEKSLKRDFPGAKSAAPSVVGFEGRSGGEQAEGEVETRRETDAAAAADTAAVGTEEAPAARGGGAAANTDGIAAGEIGNAAGAEEAAKSKAESSTVTTTSVAHPPAEEDEATAAEGKEGAATADAGSALAAGDGSLLRVAAGVKDRRRTLQPGNGDCRVLATEIWPARSGAYPSPGTRHRSRRSSRGIEGDSSSQVRQHLRAHRNLIKDVRHMISNLFPPRFRAKREEEREDQKADHEEEEQQQQRRPPLWGRRRFISGKSKQREPPEASPSCSNLEEVTAEEGAAAEGELLLRQHRQEQRRAQKLMRREFRRLIRMGDNTYKWPDSEQQQEGIDTGEPGTSGDGAIAVAGDGHAHPAGAAAAEVGVTGATSAAEEGATAGAEQQKEEEREEEQRGAGESYALREASGTLFGGALHAGADMEAAARSSRKSTGGSSTGGPLLPEAFDNVFGPCAPAELAKVGKAQPAAETVRTATAGGHEEPRVQPEAGVVGRQQQHNEINADGAGAAEAGQEGEGEEEEGDGEMAARVEEAIKGANRELARLLFEQRMLLRKDACATQRQKQQEEQQLKKLTRDSSTSRGDGEATQGQQQEGERTKHNSEGALVSTKADASYVEASRDGTTSAGDPAATASAAAPAKASSAGSAAAAPAVARSSAAEAVTAAAVCSSSKTTAGGAAVARSGAAVGEESMQEQQVLVEDATEGVSPAPSTRTWKDAWVELKRRGYAVLRGRPPPEEDEAALEETRQEAVADDEWVYFPAMEHQPLIMLQDCNFRFAQRWLEEKKKRQQNRDSLFSLLKPNFILSQKARRRRQEQWYKNFSFACSPYPKPIDLPPRFFFTGRPAAEVIFVTSTLSVRKQTFFRCKRLSNFLACRGIVYYQIDANVDSSAGVAQAADTRLLRRWKRQQILRNAPHTHYRGVLVPQLLVDGQSIGSYEEVMKLEDDGLFDALVVRGRCPTCLQPRHVGFTRCTACGTNFRELLSLRRQHEGQIAEMYRGRPTRSAPIFSSRVDEQTSWEIYFGYCGACGSRRGADDPFCPCCHLSIRDMAAAKVLGLGIYRSSVCPQCGKQAEGVQDCLKPLPEEANLFVGKPMGSSFATSRASPLCEACGYLLTYLHPVKRHLFPAGLLSVCRQSFASNGDKEASQAVSRRSSAAVERAAYTGSTHGRGSSNSSSKKLVIAEEDSAAHPQENQQGETAWQPQRQPSVVLARREGVRGEGDKGGDYHGEEGDNDEEQTTCKERKQNAEGKSSEGDLHCPRTAAAEIDAEEQNTKQHQEYAVAGDARDCSVPRDSSVRQCLSTVWEPSVVDGGNSM